MRKWLWVVFLAGLAAALVACAGPASGGAARVTGTDDVQRISPKEAKALVDSGEAVLIDTRSADSYRSQHAAGALSFPEEEFLSRIDELPQEGKALVFYCT